MLWLKLTLNETVMFNTDVTVALKSPVLCTCPLLSNITIMVPPKGIVNVFVFENAIFFILIFSVKYWCNRMQNHLYIQYTGIR